MTPEQIRERGILQVYSDMQKEYKKLLKEYEEEDAKDTNTYRVIRFMKYKYKELIERFESNGNRYFYDLQ